MLSLLTPADAVADPIPSTEVGPQMLAWANAALARPWEYREGARSFDFTTCPQIGAHLAVPALRAMLEQAGWRLLSADDLVVARPASLPAPLPWR